MGEDDFEIKEPSEYTGAKDEVYSHSQLVMSALKSCKDKRAKEMGDGYTTTKFDKFGSAFPVVIPDSRKEFIESVKSLMMIQERDYDKDATTEIEKIEIELQDKYKQLSEQEKKDWEQMPHIIKQEKMKKGFYYREGLLSADMPYIRMYVRYQVDAYTQIVSSIQKLIKRLFDYRDEIYEA